jgi:alpha-amylase
MRARKKFAYGPQRDYFVAKNCIGFVREGDDAHEGSGCAILITNKSNADSDRYAYPFHSECLGLGSRIDIGVSIRGASAITSVRMNVGVVSTNL